MSACGWSWYITFEPTKSQALTIDNHRPATTLQIIQFYDVQVQKETNIKILGVRYDDQPSFRVHVRETVTRENQRLGVIKRAAHILDIFTQSSSLVQCLRAADHGACHLVYTGASRTTLGQLGAV